MVIKSSTKRPFLFLFLSLFLAGTLITAGCSGGGGGGSTSLTDSGGSGGGSGDSGGAGGGGSGDSGGSGGSGNPYAGRAVISGTIDTSSLNSSDQALLSKALSKRLAKTGRLAKELYATDYTSDAVVKLYVVGEDGSLTDTGIVGSLGTDADGNPTYNFEGVADGVQYIIRYLKLIGDGKVLELKGNVEVPPGATAPAGDTTISPKTTVVVQTLINAILDATNGTGISKEIVDRIIDAVKDAIVALVDSGAIQIPSMVVTASGSTIDEIVSADVKNENLDSTAGILFSDSSVDVNLGTVKTTILADRFSLSDITTDDQKRALIARVFKELTEGDIPTFFIKFFGDLYVQNRTKTIGELMDAVAAGLVFRPDVPRPEITKTDVINAFKDKLTHLYDLLDKMDAGTITESEKQALADVPPVILGLFPRSERDIWTNLSDNTELIVPQGIALVIYVIDDYIPNAFADLQASFSASENEDGTISYSKEDPYNFNPMAPGSIMDIMGFYDVYQDYAGLEIYGLYLHPGVTWIDDPNDMEPGHQVDMLMADTCMSDVRNMMAMIRPDQGITGTDLSNAVVSLTYPKSDGTTGTVELVNESQFGWESDMGDTCFRLDPWMEAMAANPDPQNGFIQPDPSRIISDFTSGTYTVTVSIDGEVIAEKSFTKKVITGMTNLYATILTPRMMPIWPGANATQAQMDAFNAAMSEYNLQGATRFSANVDTDGDGTMDAAKITVTWKAPTVSLPEGVKMGYAINIGKGGCTPEGGCTWEPVFSTWDRGKLLFTTAYTIPINIPQDNDRPYQLDVSIVFVDSATGDQLGQGGNAHAEFWVAEPLDKTKTFTIVGNAAVEGAKVVLFRERSNKDSLTNPWIREEIASSDVVEGSYSLSATIGDFLDYPGAWFNIVMIPEDTSGDGNKDLQDMMIWPEWNSNVHIYFNTWGGMLRVGKDVCTTPSDGSLPQCTHSEVIILGDETVEGPTLTIPSWMVQQ